MGCSQQKMKRSSLHSVELLVHFLLISAVIQVQPLSQSQISALQISTLLTLLQISCKLIFIMEKMGGGEWDKAPIGKAHYNCLSRPHKSCISIICSKLPAIKSCKQGFWMQSQTIKMFLECLRERSSELVLWIHKASCLLISFPFYCEREDMYIFAQNFSFL